MPRSAFRAAVEAGDLDALVATLAPDVVFRSPVVFKPYQGRDATAVILGAVMQVFDDFHYVEELTGGDTEALVFRTRIGDREVQGVDFLRFDDDDRVVELTVFLRPLSGVTAARDAIGAVLPTE